MARKETYSDDMPLRELSPIIEGEEREPDIVVASAEELEEKEYAEALAFGEEIIEIVVHKGREKRAPDHVQVGVNGDMRWIRVETEVKLPRKFVEVLARSQPMDIETRITDEQADNPVNSIIRNMRSQYPFTVLHDPNPRGRAWLSRIMREG